MTVSMWRVRKGFDLHFKMQKEMTLITTLMSPHSNEWECEHRLDLCVPTTDGKGQAIKQGNSLSSRSIMAKSQKCL